MVGAAQQTCELPPDFHIAFSYSSRPQGCICVHQQAPGHMEGDISTLCLLVQLSPLVTSTKCTQCPAGAAALPPGDGFGVACSLFLWKLLFIGVIYSFFLWKLLFIPPAGFMVLLKGLFKAALICSSANGFSSKECCAGMG